MGFGMLSADILVASVLRETSPKIIKKIQDPNKKIQDVSMKGHQELKEPPCQELGEPHKKMQERISRGDLLCQDNMQDDSKSTVTGPRANCSKLGEDSIAAACFALPLLLLYHRGGPSHRGGLYRPPVGPRSYSPLRILAVYYAMASFELHWGEFARLAGWRRRAANLQV